MTPREQENQFQLKLTDSILFIALHDMPEQWLPEIVTVIEYPEDDFGRESPMLTECTLKEIFTDDECRMSIVGTDDDEPYGLCEIIHCSHIELWEKYLRLGEKSWRNNAMAYLKEHTDSSDETITAFVNNQWQRDELFADNLEAFRKALSKAPESELWIFTYPIDRFDRDAPDRQIIEDYEKGCDETPVEKMTVEEFAARLNDESFDDTHNWVRAIRLPNV